MLAREPLLIALVKLVGLIPQPQERERRRRGHPQVYSEWISVKAALHCLLHSRGLLADLEKCSSFLLAVLLPSYWPAPKVCTTH